MKAIGQEHLEGIRDDLDLYEDIRNTIARIMSVLGRHEHAHPGDPPRHGLRAALHAAGCRAPGLKAQISSRSHRGSISAPGGPVMFPLRAQLSTRLGTALTPRTSSTASPPRNRSVAAVQAEQELQRGRAGFRRCRSRGGAWPTASRHRGPVGYCDADDRHMRVAEDHHATPAHNNPAQSKAIAPRRRDLRRSAARHSDSSDIRHHHYPERGRTRAAVRRSPTSSRTAH